ncbi:MAG: adenylate/guanylate cyclase domain-containing protein [Verrucomicrobia bacterium]|nr:adenylate/guanylate cyclase domain-containing protein [Verrucomicrobiota bacterium]
MNLKFFQPENWRGALSGALLAVTLGVTLDLIHLGDGLVRWSYDLFFTFRQSPPPSEVVIVYQDEDSYKQLEQSVTSWDRTLHAQLLDRLKADQARAVVFDILFEVPRNPESDRLFAETIRTNGRVVLGGLHYDSSGFEGKARASVRPHAPFAEAAAGWGNVMLPVDADFGIRQHLIGGERVPGLDWRAAQIIGAPVTRIAENRFVKRWLNYYGPPDTFEHRSYYQAIDPDGVPEGFFRDKVVYVGGRTLAGLPGEDRDAFRTPFTWRNNVFCPGVEIHATALVNLLRQDWLTRPVPAIELGLLLVGGLLLGGGLAQFHPSLATMWAALTAAFVVGLSFLLFVQARVWFPWLLVVAVQIPAAWFSSVVFNSMKLHVQKKLLTQSLELHLAPGRVKQILNSKELLRPGGELWTISILFSDIANFVGISEKMPPDDLLKLLNKYFEASLGCIHKTDGTLVKLIGDAIFAVWNAPIEQVDHRERACRAALMLRDQLIKLDTSDRGIPMRTRIGLHVGPACVGNVGSSVRFDYTAIGENVNLASRMESLNKHLGTDILATGEIQSAVEKTLVSRKLGDFRLRGFARLVAVHELIGTLDVEESTRPWRDAFAEGVAHFQRRAFDEAVASFKRTLELHPNDGPSHFYLETIPHLREQTLSADWHGEIEMKEK